MTEIILDTREQKDLQTIVLQLNIPHKREKLPIGDFSIKDPVTNEYLCFIERKSIEDLANSIMEGRLFDQIERLEHLEKPAFLLISGSLRQLELKLISLGLQVNENTIDGTIATMGVRYGVHVIWVPDDRRLVNIAYRICLQMLQGEYMTPKSKHKKDAQPVEALTRIVSLTQAQMVLAQFLNLKNVASATTSELEKVKGIGKITAERIWRFFNE